MTFLRSRVASLKVAVWFLTRPTETRVRIMTAIVRAR